jgi:hypothetical protein
MLITSLITAIAGGAIVARQGLNNNQKLNIIRNLVKASYILSLASTVVSIIGIIVTHFTSHRSIVKTLFLLSYSIPLLIVGIYRVVRTLSLSPFCLELTVPSLLFLPGRGLHRLSCYDRPARGILGGDGVI